MSEEIEKVAIKIIKFFAGLVIFTIVAGSIIILSTMAKARTISSKAASAVAEIAQDNGTITWSDYQTIWKSIKLYEPVNSLANGDTSDDFRYYTDPTTGNREARRWINIDDIHVYRTEDWQNVKNGTEDRSNITDYVSRGADDDYKRVVQRGTALTAVVDVTVNIDVPINMSYSDGTYTFGNEEGTIRLMVGSIPAQTISVKYYKGLDD